MTDAGAIADRYIRLWNEKDADRRRELLSTNWTENATYVDPLMRGDGHSGIDALVAGVPQRFPQFQFKLIGKPDGFGDHVRFSWALGPADGESPIEGTDFAVVESGRIASVTGFLDKVPSA